MKLSKTKKNAGKKPPRISIITTRIAKKNNFLQFSTILLTIFELTNKVFREKNAIGKIPFKKTKKVNWFVGWKSNIGILLNIVTFFG